ncbi:MAG: hypothetical protein R3A45_11755 [Bdellovibrionota bacterium]
MYIVDLYDDQGALAASKEVEVPYFGTLEIEPEDFFSGSLPNLGMVSVSIKPKNIFSFKDRHLGLIRPQFYALYHDVDMNSFVLIHPQTSESDTPAASQKWKSTLYVSCDDLQYLDIFQLNPLSKPFESHLALVDQNNSILSESRYMMNARSCRKVKVNVQGFLQGACVHLESNGLAASNAKPLVFNHFKNGMFTGSHS